MAVGREIRTKISSIKNTQKITRAMEMVAASKMRKTQTKMRATRPYAKKISQIIKHLAHANPEYQHPYLVERETKRIGVIVVSSDRGLCGGLNSNLFRKMISQFKQWDETDIKVDVCSIGSKGTTFLTRLSDCQLIGQAAKLGDNPPLASIIGVIKIMLDHYQAQTIDALYLVNNAFVNTMTQNPTIEKILPIVAEDIDEELKGHWDYIYEPDAKEVLDNLLSRYVESVIYQGLVENNACEQAARMVAMKSASDNAGKLIDELQLVYNKARQAAITQEISEIVAGAAAV